MLKLFLYISSVHEINFKPPRVSPPLPHVPTIISGSNLRGFCHVGFFAGGVFWFGSLFCFLFWGFFNKYVLDGSSACES